MGTAAKHTQRERYERLHKPVPETDGGACLARHSSDYKQSSCYHRYQAAYRAEKEDTWVYEEELELSAVHMVSDSRAASLIDNDAAAKWLNDRGAWEVVPKMVKRTREVDGQEVTELVEVNYVKIVGTPFRTGFAPWPNNAHHLIPIGVLHQIIAEVSSGKVGVIDRIIQSLLRNKYNIHHHENMMILPLQAKVSYRIGLPTHRGGHTKYSDQVAAKVRKIMRPFTKWTGRKCKSPGEGKCVKPRLVNLSKQLRAAIFEERSEFRRRHESSLVFSATGEAVRGKRGSVKAMGINHDYFCDLVAKIGP